MTGNPDLAAGGDTHDEMGNLSREEAWVQVIAGRCGEHGLEERLIVAAEDRDIAGHTKTVGLEPAEHRE